MKTQEKDIYHGIALTQIVEHESFKALNKVDKKYGHYLINTSINILVKYSKKKNGKSWTFTINNNDLTTLQNDLGSGKELYICLVCAEETTCLLDGDEIQVIIDVNSESQQWIRVEMPPHSSMRVKGSAGDLSKTIPSNAFPNKIFTQMAA